jgi:orsellinic acid C2-O-methyltransferase
MTSSRFPSPMDTSAADRAFQLISGFRISQMIRAACELGIPDALSDGPRSAADLAGAAGTLEPMLRRLLRALSAVGVFTEEEDGRFAQTPISEQLMDRPGSMRGWALMLSRESYQAWAALMHPLTTGEPAHDLVFGESRFDALAKDPEASAVFNMAMQRWTEQVADVVATAYDFGSVTTVIDIGGGTGALLAGILRAHPHLRGAVFDLPSGVGAADAYLTDHGLRDRVEIETGSFFESVPSGYDRYVLKSIVHDWDDEHGVDILRTCRAAMGDDARLLLVERVSPARATESAEAQRILLSDMQMMVMLGGRERTVDEYAALLTAAGLTLTSVTPTSTEVDVIEAVPA